jgi:hypothetical protein
VGQQTSTRMQSNKIRKQTSAAARGLSRLGLSDSEITSVMVHLSVRMEVLISFPPMQNHRP